MSSSCLSKIKKKKRVGEKEGGRKKEIESERETESMSERWRERD